MHQRFRCKAEHPTDGVSVARKVLQAGPTTAERQEELRLREDAARAAVGTEVASEKFEALKSLASAEMRRIHRLYYCIKLRCMVMPTRFLFLTPATDAFRSVELGELLLDESLRGQLCEPHAAAQTLN